jgi:phosphoserine phosphatase RsbU/P
MERFGRLRVIVALLVIVVLGVTAAAFMEVTRREVTRSMLVRGDAEARNIMRVVMFDLSNQQAELDFFRNYARERHEEQLRNLVRVVVSEVDFFYDLYERGILTEEQARRSALEAVQRARYGHNDYFFVYDRNNVAISHADPRIRGRNMSASVDAKGRPIAKTLWSMTGQNRDGFLTIWWTRLGEKKPVPKLLYFYHYPKWDWLIGTGLYIDDIDRDVERKMAETMDTLKRTFRRVRVAETGYFSLFDGSGKILIHPFLENTEGALLKDPVTGNKHIQNLMAASKNPDVPYKYLWDKPDAPGDYRFWKYSHVEHFAPFNWYLSSSVYEDEMEKPAGKIIKRQTIYILMIVLISMIGVYLILARVTAPLLRLDRHADTLRKNGFAVSENGKKELLLIRFPREIGHLARTFWNMEQRLEEHLRNLQETTAAREKMASELRIARDIQMSMLPDLKAALRGRTEIDLAAALEPAREVGGDLYDFFFIDEDRFCVIVGDVSDKGVPAALFMARSKALLRSAAQGTNIASGLILQKANAELVDGNSLFMFITVFLAILNVRTGELTYSNAGHVPPVLIDRDNRCEILALPPGKPLGIRKRGLFETKRRQLQKGDGLLVFTDGVTEAENKTDGFYGEEHLLSRLQELPSVAGAACIVETVLSGIKSFGGGEPQSDDIAVVCVRYIGAVEE